MVVDYCPGYKMFWMKIATFNVVQNQDLVTFVVVKDCAVDKEQIGQKMDVMVKLVEQISMNVQQR